jgi:hypothetical protein
MYNGEGKSEKALEVLDRAIKKAKPDNAILLEAYACKGGLQNKLERFAEAEESIKKYLKYYKKYENNELEKSAFGFVISNYSAPEKRDSMKDTLALCIAKQGRINEAYALYGDEEYKTAHFEQELERLYYADRSFAKNFKSSKGKFAELMRICADENYSGLEEFINSFDPLPKGFSEAVFLALKNNLDLSGAVSKMNAELMMTHLMMVAHYNTDLPLAAINYRNDEFFYSSIKNLLFGVLLFETACSGANRLSEPEISVIYKRFVLYSSLYVCNIYNPDLLNDSDIGVLPERHRFGYFMGAAQKELDGGNKLAYIKALKKTLDSCNSMQKTIKFIIDEFSAGL